MLVALIHVASPVSATTFSAKGIAEVRDDYGFSAFSLESHQGEGLSTPEFKIEYHFWSLLGDPVFRFRGWYEIPTQARVKVSDKCSRWGAENIASDDLRFSGRYATLTEPPVANQSQTFSASERKALFSSTEFLPSTWFALELYSRALNRTVWMETMVDSLVELPAEPGFWTPGAVNWDRLFLKSDPRKTGSDRTFVSPDEAKEFYKNGFIVARASILKPSVSLGGISQAVEEFCRKQTSASKKETNKNAEADSIDVLEEIDSVLDGKDDLAQQPGAQAEASIPQVLDELLDSHDEESISLTVPEPSRAEAPTKQAAEEPQDGVPRFDLVCLSLDRSAKRRTYDIRYEIKMSAIRHGMDEFGETADPYARVPENYVAKANEAGEMVIKGLPLGFYSIEAKPLDDPDIHDRFWGGGYGTVRTKLLPEALAPLLGYHEISFDESEWEEITEDGDPYWRPDGILYSEDSRWELLCKVLGPDGLIYPDTIVPEKVTRDLSWYYGSTCSWMPHIPNWPCYDGVR